MKRRKTRTAREKQYLQLHHEYVPSEEPSDDPNVKTSNHFACLLACPTLQTHKRNAKSQTGTPRKNTVAQRRAAHHCDSSCTCSSPSSLSSLSLLFNDTRRHRYRHSRIAYTRAGSSTDSSTRPVCWCPKALRYHSRKHSWTAGERVLSALCRVRVQDTLDERRQGRGRLTTCRHGDDVEVVELPAVNRAVSVSMSMSWRWARQWGVPVSLLQLKARAQGVDVMVVFWLVWWLR
ncbi:hypothetical protein HDK77DRAFT_86837 [Phyllosticta capitalensis]